jgi:hypothetical protein
MLYMDFVKATDALMRRLTSDDLAVLLGCSKQSVHQARMAPASSGYRTPPPGWEDALARAAERQAEYFLDLAGKLGRQADKTPAHDAMLPLSRHLRSNT